MIIYKYRISEIEIQKGGVEIVRPQIYKKKTF